MTTNRLPGVPFSKQWNDALSDGAAERMPWIVQSLKRTWRTYYRAESKEKANDMAHGLRNRTGKQPHEHAIRVIHEITREAGVFLKDLYRSSDKETVPK